MDTGGPNPLRDLLDAAVRQRTVKLTCRPCRHANSFAAAPLWWLSEKNGWRDDFADVRKCCICLHRLHRRGAKIGNPTLERMDKAPFDTRLPMPSELDWKRKLRRQR